MGITTASCTASLAGALRYQSNQIEFCNGSSWTALTGGDTTCTASTKSVTRTRYGQFEICNGSSWQYSSSSEEDDDDEGSRECPHKVFIKRLISRASPSDGTEGDYSATFYLTCNVPSASHEKVNGSCSAHNDNNNELPMHIELLV